MSEEFLAKRRAALEESFFRNRDAELIKTLHDRLVQDQCRKELSAVSGITDENLLDRLIRLQLGSDTVAALSLVPLVRVAWADGSLDAQERTAVLRASVEAGIAEDGPGYRCLLDWLNERPKAELNDAWTAYVQALCETLGDEDRVAVRDGLVARAKDIAKATGGILGLGNRISETEQAEIDRIVQAFEI